MSLIDKLEGKVYRSKEEIKCEEIPQQDRLIYAKQLWPLLGDFKERLRKEGFNSELLLEDAREEELEELIRMYNGLDNLLKIADYLILENDEGMGCYDAYFSLKRPLVGIEDQDDGYLDDENLEKIVKRAITKPKLTQLYDRLKMLRNKGFYNEDLEFLRKFIPLDNIQDKRRFRDNKFIVFPDSQKVLEYVKSDVFYHELASRSEMKKQFSQNIKDNLRQILDYLVFDFLNKEENNSLIYKIESPVDYFPEVLAALKEINPSFSIFTKMNIRDYKEHLNYSIKQRLKMELQR